jgi:hypothetical protein
MRPLRRTIPIACVVLLTQACITRGQVAPVDAGNSLQITQSGTSKTGLSAADFAKTNAQTALEAIRMLRPEFLRTSMRAPSIAEPAELSVYENGRYSGPVTVLSLIPVSVLIEVRRIEPMEAKSLFGSNCQCDGGVILVRTMKP